MTIENLKTEIDTLIEISRTDTLAAIPAKKLLALDATTHNIEEIQKLTKDYYRNR